MRPVHDRMPLIRERPSRWPPRRTRILAPERVPSYRSTSRAGARLRTMLIRCILRRSSAAGHGSSDMDEQQRTIILAAITSFKDWSNILLVTTTGALAWVSTTKGILNRCCFRLCLVLFAVSIVFGIATLSLITIITEHYATLKSLPGPRAAASGKSTFPPTTLVAENLTNQDDTKENKLSFYEVLPPFTLFSKSYVPFFDNDSIYIKGVCLPQHLFFLAGIIVYAFAAKRTEEEKPASPIVLQLSDKETKTTIDQLGQQMQQSAIDKARDVAIKTVEEKGKSKNTMFWLAVLVAVTGVISIAVQSLVIWLKA